MRKEIRNEGTRWEDALRGEIELERHGNRWMGVKGEETGWEELEGTMGRSKWGLESRREGIH